MERLCITILCFCIRSVERSLGKFIDEKKHLLLKDKGLPIEGCVVVAGRTDKGVTAYQQVCSFCMLFHAYCVLATKQYLPSCIAVW